MDGMSASEALRAISIADVIFGIAVGGQKKILLVIEADADGFVARHVTSQHPDFVLSRAEVQLILHAEEFFEAHPLPDR